MVISQHVTLGELIRSETAKRNGISNMPTPEHIENLKALCEHIFEPIRAEFRVPIYISSGYRSKALNNIVKGSATSQHCKGEAIDIDMDGSTNGVTNKMVFDYIKDNLPFDQLIWEFGTDQNCDWVHVSYNKQTQRKQVLKAYKINGATKYINY
jgi:NADH dehydrogenase FAD-containing subunit